MFKPVAFAVEMSGKLEELGVTRTEMEQIGEAFKNEEFRKLFAEYCEEITSEDSRKKYEQEITELEKERGVDVTFVYPKPGYVIKTSLEGNKIAFLNICTNENVDKPSFKAVIKDGSRGNNWSLPHFLSPPREDLNKKRKRCTVFDVIFHPDSLSLSSKHKEFRNFVNTVACEAVQSNHNVKLDQTNIKFPKMSYKGYSRPLIIRKKTNSFKEISSEDPVDKMYADMYKKIDETSKFQEGPTETTLKSTENLPKYQEPKYVIKHSSQIEMESFTNHSTSKINAAIPKKLVVEVCLPLLKTSAELTLDVTKKSIRLKSEKSAKYKLDLNLPYEVDEDMGNAKFDQDLRKLVITLPVSQEYNKSTILTHIEEEEESKEEPLVQILPSPDDQVLDTPLGDSPIETFLDPSFHYSFPDYKCRPSENSLVFTLFVKNVQCDSLKIYSKNTSSVHVKFSSMSPAYVPINYAFFLYLPTYVLDRGEDFIKIWNDCVVVEVRYIPEESVGSYWVGVSEETIEEREVEMDEDDDDDD